MSTIVRRFLMGSRAGVSVRAAGAGGGPGMLEGYAAVFFDAADEGTRYLLWDDVEERIMPGAFDRAIREKDDVAALFNHDWNQVLGRTVSGTARLSVDDKGLRYEVDAPDTQAGRDVVTIVKRGDVRGSSFAFETTDVRYRREKRDGREVLIREVLGCRLYDVSPVLFPAYPATSVDARGRPLQSSADERSAILAAAAKVLDAPAEEAAAEADARRRSLLLRRHPE